MALIRSLRPAGVWAWLHSNAGIRFIRFAGAAALALITSLITVAVCDAVFHLTSGPTALISQVTGAVVSYLLSRWAWERKGRPDLLRETLPFWIAFGVATLISWGFTKLGYYSAAEMHLHGLRHVAVVEVIYFIGNVVTFLLRFVFFHYILFTDTPASQRPRRRDNRGATSEERAPSDEGMRRFRAAGGEREDTDSGELTTAK